MVLVVAESAIAPVQQFLVGAGLKAWQAGVVEAAGGEGATVEPSVELVGKYPS
jgi:hypothetical protein